MRLLAISGSLRVQSTNTDALRALMTLAAGEDEAVLSEMVGQLPLFNPDDDHANVSNAVLAFRSSLRVADAIVICTPEYAHGIPGALKNALDWVVSSGELYDKTVGIINTAERAIHVGPALQEVLATMGARTTPGVTLPLSGCRLSPEEIAANELYREQLLSFLHSVRQYVSAGAGPLCNR